MAQAPFTQPIGYQLPDYLQIPEEEIKKNERIAKGTYGAVYHGNWQNTDVAIKEIALERLQDLANTNAFFREIELMHRCTHPRIVRLYGYFIAADRCSIVMEYIKSSLDQLLNVKEHPHFPWPTRIKIAIDIAKALKYLHSRTPPILHRDLKSMNVLIDEKFHAKICDFGQSKLKEATAQAPQMTGYVGTARWKAPELLLPQNKPTEKSDIFSFGMLLWELATRKLPHSECTDEFQVAAKIARGEDENIPADCQQRYADLIKKCWNRVAAQRPELDEILAELVAIKYLFQKSWRFGRDIEKPHDLHGEKVKFLEVDANALDYQLVKRLYEQNPDPRYEIARVEVIFNPSIRKIFKDNLRLLEKRHLNAAFDPKWRTTILEDRPHQIRRSAVFDLFQRTVQGYKDDSFPHLSFLPVWHGVNDPNIIPKICETAFAALGKTDVGFFGKGIYTTPDAEYAHRVYAGSNCHLLLNWVAIYSPFPVIDGDGLEEKNHFENYDAHFIPVVPRDPKKPDEVEYDACRPDQPNHKYTEVVVFDKGQCLPAYRVTLKEVAKAPAPNIQNAEQEADQQFLLNDFIAATENYGKALKIATDNAKKADLYGKLGRVWQMRGDHHQAISHYYEAVKLQTQTPNENLGFILSQMGQVCEASGNVWFTMQNFPWINNMADFNTQAKWLKNLTYLKIASFHGGFKVTDQMLNTLANHIEALNTVIINIPSNLTRWVPLGGLQSLGPKLNGLTHLRIEQCPPGGSSQILQNLSPHLKGLKVLELTTLNSMDMQLIQNFTTLETLNISILNLPFGQGIDYTKLASLTKLQSLTFAPKNILDLHAIRVLQNLKVLKLDSRNIFLHQSVPGGQITSKWLIEFLEQNLPGIAELDFVNFFPVNTALDSQIGARLKNLKILKVSKGMNEQVVQAILSNTPNLLIERKY